MALSPHDSPDGDAASPVGDSMSFPRLSVHCAGDAGRAEVEDFIRGVFSRRYGADLRSFAPTLVSLRDGDEIVAAAGYRSGAAGSLFLERYLDGPVESLLAAAADAQPERRRIVEVGHLAASRPGEGRRLISLLGPHLAAQEFTWVVGTITTELRHLFVRLGVTPLAIGMAHPAALGAEAVHWGSYYDHGPLVLAGHLDQALRRFARRAQRAGAAR